MPLHDILLISAVASFAVSMLLVAVRLLAPDGTKRIVYPGEIVGQADEPASALPLEDRFRELLELGMIQLEPEEHVVTGCGMRGEIEEILIVTNRRAFILNRRSGATFFAKHTFNIEDLKPVPSSAGLVGNKMILTDGAQTRAIDSPGSGGFLAEAQVVVRELNSRIRAAKHGVTL